ncbi:hypothetical protein MOSE0_K05600 [Monosporozyma servazzii]
MSSEEGASLSEQLLDASRRNNDDLFETIVESVGGNREKLAALINGSHDPMGNTAFHLCCQYGSWEVLDKILDLDADLEVDPRNKRDGDTPLHVAVRYAVEEPEHGTFIAQNLIEVGADPRIRNNNGQKPADLIHGDELDDLFDLLQGAELAADNGGVSAMEAQEAEVIEDDDDDDDDVNEEAIDSK